ncbi:MAG: hypothetical protein K2P41_15205, partial [Lachnospiraceae bacterium]|nr:hypothetical protein [Lachnospiraceae bacterium]
MKKKAVFSVALAVLLSVGAVQPAFAAEPPFPPEPEGIEETVPSENEIIPGETVPPEDEIIPAEPVPPEDEIIP